VNCRDLAMRLARIDAEAENPEAGTGSWVGGEEEMARIEVRSPESIQVGPGRHGSSIPERGLSMFWKAPCGGTA
jgi:hypothetical protein